MHVNLVHWNSLHQKRPFYLLVQDRHPIFSVKITKPGITTYTIGKLVMLRFFLSLRVGVQHVQNVLQYGLSQNYWGGEVSGATIRKLPKIYRPEETFIWKQTKMKPYPSISWGSIPLLTPSLPSSVVLSSRPNTRKYALLRSSSLMLLLATSFLARPLW